MAGMVKQPQQHHRGADDAGGGRQDDADQADRDRQAAVHLSEQALHRLHHFFGNAGTIQHEPHENEHRQGHQDPVVHQLVDAVDAHAVDDVVNPGKGVQVLIGQHADTGKEHRRAAQHPGDGKSRKQQGDKRAEHGDNEIIADLHELQSP